MIYTEQTTRAMRVAYQAHHGQTDKSGAPYIHHPLHLAESMTTEAETVAALLHDVVEDTPTTCADLLAEGFSPEAVEAVRLLTHTDDVSYDDYIRAIRQNPIARRVKIADLTHNMDLTRLGMTEAAMTDKVRARREKYAHSLAYLQPKVAVRHATMDDLDAVAAVEAECFPPAEAATRESFAARLHAYPDRFWLLFEDERLVSFVNGMATDEPDLRDEMYENASLHNPTGAWQMIFGVNTLPERRKNGLAARLIEEAVHEARERGCKGLVLTCKPHMLHYYSRFGFVNEGLSDSTHGDVQWYQMRLTF